MDNFDTPIILKTELTFVMSDPTSHSNGVMLTVKAGTIGNVMSNGMDGLNTVRFYNVGGSDYVDVFLESYQMEGLTQEEWKLYGVIYE